MSKNNPNVFVPPLRTRADMTAFLLTCDSGIRSRHYFHHDGVFRFSFNVKLYGGLDFSFDHLLEVFKKYEGNSELEDADYVQRLREKFIEEFGSDGDDANTTKLWEWAIEDAQRPFIEGNYNILPNGTEVKLEWNFLGRSSGWLVLTKFEGYDLEGTDEELITSMPFKDLRKLYQLVATTEQQWAGTAPEREVEFLAAFTFFHNLAIDVERPNTQLAVGI